MWSPLASASLVFLALYTLVFAILSYWFVTKQIKLRSRWSVLYFHVLCRLASQACGVAFGIIGYSNIHLLIAYFVLGAEGYFTLVLCTGRFLISWQNHHFGDSWLERKNAYPKQMPWYHKMGKSLSIRGIKQHPMTWVHWMLIAANAIIIAGGSMSAGAYTDGDLSPTEEQSRQNTSKGMRAAGQTIFLVINMALFACIAFTVHQARQKLSAPWYGHPTLLLLLVTWPFLAARGIFGVVQAVTPDLNYFNADVYDKTNLTEVFVVTEACLATMTECVSCWLLLFTYFTSRTDPSQKELHPSYNTSIRDAEAATSPDEKREE